MNVIDSPSRTLVLSLFGVVTALAFSGCASDKAPTAGDQMLAVGESHQQLGDKWNAHAELKAKAEKDITAAKKAIKKAEKDLDEAREDLVDANERLAEGHKGIAEAEAEFQRLFPGQSMQPAK